MDREFKFTDEDFAWLRKLALERVGISLAESKMDMIYNRLARRIRRLGLGDFASYVMLLKRGDEEELEQFTNAVTTNLTRFFREPHHFTFLRNEFSRVGPEAEAKSPRVLRVWSAGCSSGEEAYSIAMTLHDVPALRSTQIHVVASDIDSAALARAEAGAYPIQALEGIDYAMQKRWFLRGRGQNDGLVKVKSDLSDCLSFVQHNLVGAWPDEIAAFNVVFCRNVMIYFDKTHQQRLIERIAECLVPPGLLFIGHSESLYGISSRFELLGQTLYRKIA
jgi:chemotaxis protein methyltransferase CheR